MFLAGVFMHDSDGNKEKEWWKCDGVYGFCVFVSFFYIWDEWVGVDIIRCKGAAKQWGVGRIFIVELKKEEQEGK